MKISLLFILLFLVSCASTSKKQNDIIIHDIDIDFPIADTIEFSPRQSFEILADIGSFWHVKDSVFFVKIYNNPDRLGICYNINNGKELSTIINLGRAANEVTTSCLIEYSEDSIHFCDIKYHSIKTFAIADIVSKPMSERNFSVNKIPDTLYSKKFTKINSKKIFGINNNNNPLFTDISYLYFTYNGKNLSFFGNVREEIFETQKDYELSKNTKGVFQTANIAISKNKIVVAEKVGMALHVIDPYQEKIIKERYYSKYKYKYPDNKSLNYTTTTGKYQRLEIYCSDEYIYYIAQIKDERKSAETDTMIFERHIFVFDWNLNPVKKYFFSGEGTLNLSHDGKSLYLLTTNDEKSELLEYEF